MKIYHFEKIDSTSSLAHNFLKEKVHCPFAVHANQQSYGRGQQGKIWASPKGNLYMSFALRTEEKLDSRTPLYAALILAQWIEERFQITPTLKWPNDILVATRKLAGILCESFNLEDQQFLIIGIGLNLNLSPERSSVALKDLTLKKYNPHELANSLSLYWEKNWRNRIPETFSAQFQFYHFVKGHLWVNRRNSEEFFSYEGIDPTGSLILKSLRDKKAKPILINSANHHYRWAYQELSCPLIIADLGNSVLKLALYHSHGDKKCLLFRIPIPFQEDLLKKALDPLKRELFKYTHQNRKWPIFCCSVNDTTFNKLQKYESSFQWIKLPKKSIRLRSSYTWDELGLDRIANMEGWIISQHQKRQPIPPCRQIMGIIVSAGTATTIDVVSLEGKHLGGVIIPGLQTGLNCLAKASDFLPTLQFDKASVHVKNEISSIHSTSSSMANGVFRMTTALIENIKRETTSLFPEAHIDCVLTGGFSSYLAKHTSYHLSKHLTLIGIKSLALGGLHHFPSPSEGTSCQDEDAHLPQKTPLSSSPQVLTKWRQTLEK